MADAKTLFTNAITAYRNRQIVFSAKLQEYANGDISPSELEDWREYEYQADIDLNIAIKKFKQSK